MRTVLAVCLSISVACLLSSCASPEERASASCQKYGFQPGTDSFANCMAMAATMQANQVNASQGLMSSGLQMMQMSQPQYVAPMRPFTCVRQGVFTNCY